MSGPGGKGSTQRPTNDKSYSEGYERIFGNKQPSGQPEKEPEKVKQDVDGQTI